MHAAAGTLRASAALARNRMAAPAQDSGQRNVARRPQNTATSHALFARQISGLPRARGPASLEPLMERGLLACALPISSPESQRSREDHRTLGTYRRDALEYVNTLTPCSCMEIQEAFNDSIFTARSRSRLDHCGGRRASRHTRHALRPRLERIAAITRQPVEWGGSPRTA